MHVPNVRFNKDAAIAIARSLVQRHDFEAYLRAVERTAVSRETKEEIIERAKYCFYWTDFAGSHMDFEDRSSFTVVDDETDAGCWLVGWLLQPIGCKDADGNGSPIQMKINKNTGEISDLWAEPAL